MILPILAIEGMLSFGKIAAFHEGLEFINTAFLLLPLFFVGLLVIAQLATWGRSDLASYRLKLGYLFFIKHLLLFFILIFLFNSYEVVLSGTSSTANNGPIRFFLLDDLQPIDSLIIRRAYNFTLTLLYFFLFWWLFMIPLTIFN